MFPKNTIIVNNLVKTFIEFIVVGGGDYKLYSFFKPKNIGVFSESLI